MVRRKYKRANMMAMQAMTNFSALLPHWFIRMNYIVDKDFLCEPQSSQDRRFTPSTQGSQRVQRCQWHQLHREESWSLNHWEPILGI